MIFFCIRIPVFCQIVYNLWPTFVNVRSAVCVFADSVLTSVLHHNKITYKEPSYYKTIFLFSSSCSTILVFLKYRHIYYRMFKCFCNSPQYSSELTLPSRYCSLYKDDSSRLTSRATLWATSLTRLSALPNTLFTLPASSSFLVARSCCT
jgi:hypothetical protein